MLIKHDNLINNQIGPPVFRRNTGINPRDLRSRGKRQRKFRKQTFMQNQTKPDPAFRRNAGTKSSSLEKYS
jgi:hypothetical protein